MSDSIILPRKSLFADAKPADDPSWYWPLPRLAGDTPKVTAHINDERCAVHVGYERVTFTGLFVPVYAAHAGTISYAERTSNGCAISIEHARKWCTHYAHLKEMFVVPTYPTRRRRGRVKAGDVIGYAAANPIHIRFELWRWTDEDGFVPDLAGLRMNAWLVLPQVAREAPPVLRRRDSFF
jgi:hypothetical protein